MVSYEEGLSVIGFLFEEGLLKAGISCVGAHFLLTPLVSCHWRMVALVDVFDILGYVV